MSGPSSTARENPLDLTDLDRDEARTALLGGLESAVSTVDFIRANIESIITVFDRYNRLSMLNQIVGHPDNEDIIGQIGLTLDPRLTPDENTFLNIGIDVGRDNRLITPETAGNYRRILMLLSDTRPSSEPTTAPAQPPPVRPPPELPLPGLPEPKYLAPKLAQMSESEIYTTFGKMFASLEDAGARAQVEFFDEYSVLIRNHLEANKVPRLFLPILIKTGNIIGLKRIIEINGEPLSIDQYIEVAKRAIDNALLRKNISPETAAIMTNMLKPSLIQIIQWTPERRNYLKEHFLMNELREQIFTREQLLDLYAALLKMNFGRRAETHEVDIATLLDQYFQPYFKPLTKNGIEIMRNRTGRLFDDVVRVLEGIITPITPEEAKSRIIYKLETTPIAERFIREYQTIIMKWVPIEELVIRLNRHGNYKTLNTLLNLIPITTADVDRIMTKMISDRSTPKEIAKLSSIIQEAAPDAWRESAYVAEGLTRKACYNTTDPATLDDFDANLYNVVSFILPPSARPTTEGIKQSCVSSDTWYEIIKTTYLARSELYADRTGPGVSQLYLWNDNEPVVWAPVYSLPGNNLRIQSREPLLQMFRVYQLESIGTRKIGTWGGVIASEVGTIHGREEEIHIAKPIHWRDYMNWVQDRIPIPKGPKFGEAAFIPVKEDFNPNSPDIDIYEIPAMITFGFNGTHTFYDASGKVI